jgi:hypothetical protein
MRHTIKVPIEGYIENATPVKSISIILGQLSRNLEKNVLKLRTIIPAAAALHPITNNIMVCVYSTG